MLTTLAANTDAFLALKQICGFVCAVVPPTSRHGHSDRLFVLGRARSSTHNAVGVYDGSSPATSPTRGAHHKRAGADGLLRETTGWMSVGTLQHDGAGMRN